MPVTISKVDAPVGTGLPWTILEFGTKNSVYAEPNTQMTANTAGVMGDRSASGLVRLFAFGAAGEAVSSNESWS